MCQDKSNEVRTSLCCPEMLKGRFGTSLTEAKLFSLAKRRQKPKGVLCVWIGHQGHLATMLVMEDLFSIIDTSSVSNSKSKPLNDILALLFPVIFHMLNFNVWMRNTTGLCWTLSMFNIIMFSLVIYNALTRQEWFDKVSG